MPQTPVLCTRKLFPLSVNYVAASHFGGRSDSKWFWHSMAMGKKKGREPNMNWVLAKPLRLVQPQNLGPDPSM